MRRTFCTNMVKALVVIDMQNEWITEDSDYYVGDISKAIEKTNSLIDTCREQDYKIIFTRHVEEESDNVFAENHKRSALMNNLHREQSDVVITKYRISPFYKTSLENELEGFEEVVVCGILTNLCVRSFIEGAYDRDLDIKVIKDCCVAFDEKTQEFTFGDLKATREEVDFIDLDRFLS